MTDRDPSIGRLGADLTDLDNFASGFPHALFEKHRVVAPVWWHEPTANTPDGEGFWSVATYSETVAIQMDAATYSSETGGDRPYGGTLLQDLPVAGIVLNMMDDPRHARIRRLVSLGFTPRMIGRLEDELRRRTRAVLARVDDTRAVDFLVDVAAELPMQMICMLLGVPESDRFELFEWVEHIFDIREGNNVFEPTPEIEAQQLRMLEYGSALIAEKRVRPADDMLSIVVHASLPDLDPPSLTDLELYAFFSLLFSAGADTTRNAIAGGMLALMQHPEQLDALRADPSLLPVAIEEILRWTSPSPAKRRTATVATELGGHRIEPGDKVLFWEGSANRDERVFARSMEFDIRRDPNPHLAFGHGVHFCLGASLARLELRVILDEVLGAFTTFEQVAQEEWTRSNRHTGLRHLPMRMTRA